jgi:tetratricopeptide (TPR) repeat protein
MSEIESVLLDREVDGLVGMALSYAADGEFPLATGIAAKVERLAPWSPRYLQLQVYLDEEGARRRADGLVATAREHLAAGRGQEARAAALAALVALPGHPLAHKLIEQLPEALAPPPATVAPPPPPPPSPPAEKPGPPSPPPDARAVEAAALSAAALRHFMKDEHDEARRVVERALALDPANRRARDLQKILRVLG